jgi:hypothetical protein
MICLCYCVLTEKRLSVPQMDTETYYDVALDILQNDVEVDKQPCSAPWPYALCR